jgi:aerobic-type carbon monoxide dehydrogenase small subunit (CoxS/CutS family)
MIPFELAEPASLAAAITLLDPDDPTIRQVAGNLCRCAAYPEVLDAVKLAARKSRTVT